MCALDRFTYVVMARSVQAGKKQHHSVAAVSSIAARALEENLAFNVHAHTHYDGIELRVRGHERPMINFGGCSYLGLDQHPALKEGAIDATRRYGTQFSFSRAYMASPLYDELEELLDRITGGVALVTPTTSLGHIAAMGSLFRSDDHIVIDKSAHASLHTACATAKQVRAQSIIRHNDLDELERITIDAPGSGRIWYVLDGIYSMYGDVAPFQQLNDLMARRERLCLYVDDAHATSCLGTNGRGLALEAIHDRSRTIVALSLNKAFSAAGGALVLSAPEQKMLVRGTGGPMLFSGPVQPPMLGAAVASAKLHMSPTIDRLQALLRLRMQLVIDECSAMGISVEQSMTPIFFAVCGNTEAAFAATKHLRDAGYYTSPGVYPAVPRTGSGVRFTVSALQTEASVRSFVSALRDGQRTNRP